MPDPLSFVDIETTGTNAVSGRIIEIGILRVENNKVIKTFETLVNPQLRIDPFIEKMTGINYQSLTKAPLFEDIKDNVLEILEDSIFVAHNVRFDYSFVRNEFKRLGVSFKNSHFCTVKLARFLYPNLDHYNLDSIMANFKIKNQARHRAFGDAKVLWDFFKLSQKINQKDKFEEALKFVLKKPTLPSTISQETIDNLPESPGVYIFYGEDTSSAYGEDANSVYGENTSLTDNKNDTNQSRNQSTNQFPLYIGKSINIKDRVLSHFANDYGSNTDMKIVQTIKSIETLKTAGELSALLLESTLIKKEKPLYNRMLRESRKMLVLLKKTNKNGFNTIETKTLGEIKVEEIENILGVFRSQKQLKDFLYDLCKTKGLCPKLMGLDKTTNSCLYFQMGICTGACREKELNLKYNLRFDEAFYKSKVKTWPFTGPILIKEQTELTQIHLVDKWCYLASLKNEFDTIKDLKKDYVFDYDTYKILRRYISNPYHQKNITLLT